MFKWLFDGRKNPSFQVLLFIPIEILRQSGRHHPPLPPPGTNPTGNTQQVCQLSPVINANCSLYSIWLFDFISLILLELELATRLPRAGRARERQIKSSEDDVQVKAHGGIQKKRLECLLYVCCSYVCGCLFFYPPTHTFFGLSRHVTHLAYTWTCVCNEPEIKVRQHSREDIKVIYDPGRCYENLPFYLFFYFLFSKNPRLCTLDPRHVTLDPRPSTKTQTLI